MKISKRKILLATVIVFIIAGAGVGVLIAVQAPFLQEIKETVFVQQQEPSAIEQALNKENEELRERVAELEQELSLQTDQKDEARDGFELNTNIVMGFEQQKEVYKELAEYYANMEPDVAVAILNTQASQLVAGILHEMEKDQAGEILSRLDPQQAAELIELIAAQVSLEEK